jgi:diketogulonate reductase-like aldo/keto reductase
VYANTQSVGDALKQWGGKREDVYILTKWGKSQPGSDVNEPRKVLEGLLKELGTDYVDLYLIHFPKVTDRPLADTWKVFEQIKRDGLARSIGVSNFAAEKIEELAKTWEIPAAVNQMWVRVLDGELTNTASTRPTSTTRPRLSASPPCRRSTTSSSRRTALSSLSRTPGGPVDPVVKKIAEAHKATEAQVLLKWAQQFGGGTVVT